MGRKGPRVERRKDGALVLRDLPPALGLALQELRVLLRPDGDGRPARLAGSPYSDDEEGDAHWRKHARPELLHLFESARATVLRDLDGLISEFPFGGRQKLAIPADHLAAWHSTLAGVRVALGDRHGVTAFEMDEGFPGEIANERDRAVLLVHLLGWVQGLLLDPEEGDGAGK
jgi:hypothetical protein